MITGPQDWFLAVAGGNVDDVRAAMGDYVGTRDDTGDTALIIAARMGETELVRLLATTEEVGLINKEGCTALIAAAMSNKPDTCEILADLEKAIPLKDGRDALMLAAFMMNYEAVSVLIKHMDLVEDSNQMNALDYAVIGGSLKVVKEIVESQENIDEKLDYAIFLATEPVKEDILAYLKQVRGVSPSDQMHACTLEREPVPSVLDTAQQNKLEDRLKQAVEERDAVADELTNLNAQLSGLFTSVCMLRKKRLAMNASTSGHSSAALTNKTSAPLSGSSFDAQQDQQITTLSEALTELNILVDLPFTCGSGDDYEGIEDQIKQLSRAVSELQDLNMIKDEEIAELKRAFETDIEGNLPETISQKDAKIEELQTKIREQDDMIKKLSEELEKGKAPSKNIMTMKAELRFKDQVISGLLSTIQKQERSFSAVRSAFQHKEVETQKYRTAISCSESTVKSLITANDYERARFSARNSLAINSPLRLSGAWGAMLSEDLVAQLQKAAEATSANAVAGTAPDATVTPAMPPMASKIAVVATAANAGGSTSATAATAVSPPADTNPASIASITRLGAIASPSTRQRDSLHARSGRLNISDEEKAELRKSIRMKMEENKMLKEALINVSPSDTETKVLRDEIDRLKSLLRTASPRKQREMGNPL